MPAAVQVSRHPLILHNLAALRDVRTEPPEFRRVVRDLAQLLFYEATADLKLAAGTVRTPLAECACQRIAETVGLVPILRAGLAWRRRCWKCCRRRRSGTWGCTATTRRRGR